MQLHQVRNSQSLNQHRTLSYQAVRYRYPHHRRQRPLLRQQVVPSRYPSVSIPLLPMEEQPPRRRHQQVAIRSHLLAIRQALPLPLQADLLLAQQRSSPTHPPRQQLQYLQAHRRVPCLLVTQYQLHQGPLSQHRHPYQFMEDLARVLQARAPQPVRQRACQLGTLL